MIENYLDELDSLWPVEFEMELEEADVEVVDVEVADVEVADVEVAGEVEDDLKLVVERKNERDFVDAE